jgi:peptidoglycan/xylan/chitin deacetylase (PgdA/CDA1 family)
MAKFMRQGVVLAYHAIADLSDDPVLATYSVPPPLFEAQLDALSRAGWTFIDAETFLAGLDDRALLPDRAVLLTFDDGYADLLDVVLPIVAPRRIPFAAFVVADRIGDTNAWEEGAARLRLLDAEGVRALHAAGAEIGSHGSTHRNLTTLARGEAEREVRDSAARIAELGLPRPRLFAYPYGAADRDLAGAVLQAGYTAALTTTWGSVGRRSTRGALPRIQVHASDSPRTLQLKLLSARLPSRILAIGLSVLGAVRR